MHGWSWSMRGRIPNDEDLTQQQNYAYVSRGLACESEGSNRNVPVGVADAGHVDAVALETIGGVTYNYDTLSALLPGGTANLLPGSCNIAATNPVFGNVSGQQEGNAFVAISKRLTSPFATIAS